LLAEPLRQFLRDQPSRQIGHAARRERDDDLHRLVLILRAECRTGNKTRHAERDRTHDSRHRTLLPLSVALDAHSIFSLAARTTLPHFSISALICVANCAGVLATVRNPSASSFALVSGWATIFAMSR